MSDTKMIPVGQFAILGDESGALLLSTPGSKMHGAALSLIIPEIDDAVANNPDVVAAAQAAVAGVGAVVSKGSSSAYLDVAVARYTDPIIDPLTDSLVSTTKDGTVQLRIPVLDERNQLQMAAVPESPKDAPPPPTSAAAAITSDGLTSAGLPVTVSRLMDPLEDYVTDELEAGGRSPQQAVLVTLGADGTIPVQFLPPSILPSGMVTAFLTGDPSDPDVTLYANGVEL